MLERVLIFHINLFYSTQDLRIRGEMQRSGLEELTIEGQMEYSSNPLKDLKLEMIMLKDKTRSDAVVINERVVLMHPITKWVLSYLQYLSPHCWQGGCPLPMITWQVTLNYIQCNLFGLQKHFLDFLTFKSFGQYKIWYLKCVLWFKWPCLHKLMLFVPGTGCPVLQYVPHCCDLLVSLYIQAILLYKLILYFLGE